ncbi:GNAT family N-acetyltransferase [Butyricicoccus sp. Marseille-Q5471]|uniref:GNAT family N-acetyltransferase n=1 Tax=Butyricicoccus sp. Marseille-Q5471 TaxID=3039493 RepID=UPI0024BC2766|nr:GNAT family N-acetyltransferase [Butyricicoccus sp. Marseille-Q5471]
MIRFARDSECTAVRELWEACFPDESGFNDYFFQHIFSVKQTLVYEQNGELCAMLQMLPYRIAVGSDEGEVTYIYGACTSPLHRRKGLMAQLLERSFELDRAAGRVASILIPAEEWLFGFYRRFGYESAFYVSRTQVRDEQKGILPRRLRECDIPALEVCYQRSRGDCAVLRDAAEWKRQMKLFDTLGKGVFGWFDGNELTAYAFCWEDAAQEAMGLTDVRAQGLLDLLGVDELIITTIGSAAALGCAKWYGTIRSDCGYMNLMLN